MKFFDLMKEAANEVGLELTEVQYEQFIKYMRLLQERNSVIRRILFLYPFVPEHVHLCRV